jgi:hypothetical protein
MREVTNDYKLARMAGVGASLPQGDRRRGLTRVQRRRVGRLVGPCRFERNAESHLMDLRSLRVTLGPYPRFGLSIRS